MDLTAIEARVRESQMCSPTSALAMVERIRELEAALAPFANYAREVDSARGPRARERPSSQSILFRAGITSWPVPNLGNCRRAARAVDEGRGGG